MDSAAESKQPGIEDAAALISLLRRFHYGEPAAATSTTAPPGAILPALLNPYRDSSAIRYQYPLYLVPPGDGTDEVLARPLTEQLTATVESFAPGAEQAKILKDNLPWLERYLRQQLTGPDPVDAPALFAEAAEALQAHLDLKDSNRENLEAGLAGLREGIAKDSEFLAYGPDVPLHLFVHAARRRLAPRREALQRGIEKRAAALESLLRVEKSKSTEGNEPGSISSSVGPAGLHLDSDALSGMLGERSHGSQEMAAERRARIEAALETLQGWNGGAVLVRFAGRVANPWFAEQADVDVVESYEACATASELFVDDAARFGRLFAAMRIADLEIEDRYDPPVHDSWFASFDWQAFSDDELQLVTRSVALESADYLATDGLPMFSHLLGSRLPVAVLTWVRAYDNPAVKPGDGPFDAYRFELANFGIGHRQVVVAQTSAARHEDLVAGFLCALDSNRTSLHLVNRGTQTKTSKPILEPWFVASAALESRAHPFLLINPDAGDHAAKRVRFDGNPQPDADWPVETLQYKGADGEETTMELAFTFADYALLMPALHEHFRTVPAGFESEQLVTVADYLHAEDEGRDRLVPFVWGIGEDGVLVRLVVSRALVFACRDRLNYWHGLQELAGVQNYYVEEAIERIIEEQRAAMDAEREQLLQEHAEALEAARSEAAGEAMGQLVDVLMGADLSGMVGGSGQLATMPAARPAETEAPPEAPGAEAEAEAAAEEAEEPEEELSFDEPWLDTPSCTTCDDCMGINKMMFAYNDDKQAYLVDPKAGTYEDLVRAAEICPAKCIHPGKPLNPSEPNLEELMARAAPFN
jgi:ferredoxin